MYHPVFFRPAGVIVNSDVAKAAILSTVPILEVGFSMEPVFTDAPVPSLRTTVTIRPGLQFVVSNEHLGAGMTDEVRAQRRYTKAGQAVTEFPDSLFAEGSLRATTEDGTTVYEFFSEDEVERLVQHVVPFDQEANPFFSLFSLPFGVDGTPLISTDMIGKIGATVTMHAKISKVIADAGESMVVLNTGTTLADALGLDGDGGDHPEAAAPPSMPSITVEQLQAHRTKLNSVRSNLTQFFAIRPGTLTFTGTPAALRGTVVTDDIERWLEDNQGFSLGSIIDEGVMRALMLRAVVDLG